MSSTMVDGAYIIRCAIGATLTEERHVIRAWKVIQEHADALLSKNQCKGIDTSHIEFAFSCQ